MVNNYRYIHASVKRLLIEKALHHNRRTISCHLSLSTRTANRVVRKWKMTGSVIARPANRGRNRELSTIYCLFLESCIDRTPDIYLSELREELCREFGINVTEATIHRTLLRRGLTRKVVTRPAAEANEDTRERYILNIALNYQPDQLVFVDESAYNRHVSRRRYAWARAGARARRADFFVRGKRYALLPAISLDGVLHATIQPASHTAETFKNFILGLLEEMNPFPQSNSVIIMDNASIHKSEDLRNIVERRGMRLLYLPAYSPDLNPIEEAFSSIKAWIRRHRDYVLAEMGGGREDQPYRVLFEAIATVTPKKISGWYRDSGYL